MNYRFTLCLTIVLCSIKSLALAVQEEPYQEPLQEGLTILLDRTNTEFLGRSSEANTFLFIKALHSQQPILLSQSLFANLFISQDALIIEMKNKLLKEQIFEKWIIKEIDAYYLLIPKNKAVLLGTYLHFGPLKELSVEDVQKKFTTLNVLLMLGYSLIERDVILSAFFSQTSPLKTLSKLFLPPSNNGAPMLWTVYLGGHGTYELYLHKSKIADLTIREFQELLNFLESKMRTKLFLYGSCYAGGSNKIKAFNDTLQKDIQKTYSFPIIITSINEGVSYASLDFDYEYLYERLFKENYSLPDYYDILEKAGFLPYVHNMPQIRLPGTGWFSVEGLNRLQKNPSYEIISKVKSLTQKSPMTIKPPTYAVFVYAPSIPFKIIATGEEKSSFLFVYMVPGLHEYHFAEIESEKLDLKDIVRSLSRMPQETPLNYLVYIDKITCLYQGKLTVFSDCMLTSKPNMFTTGHSTKLYATMLQNDGTKKMGVYDSGTFTTTYTDYIRYFWPARPFERLTDLEKAIEHKALVAKLEQDAQKQRLRYNG